MDLISDYPIFEILLSGQRDWIDFFGTVGTYSGDALIDRVDCDDDEAADVPKVEGMTRDTKAERKRDGCVGNVEDVWERQGDGWLAGVRGVIVLLIGQDVRVWSWGEERTGEDRCREGKGDDG